MAKFLCGVGLMKKSFLVYMQLGCPKAVVSGPFQGMKCLPAGTGAWVARLVSTYEMELHPVIETSCNMKFDRIINVGTAEGYYAIGYAKRIRNIPVICYEDDKFLRGLLIRHAKLNDVLDRFDVQGFCTPAELQESLSDSNSPLLVLDCEGYEIELLDPVQLPRLTFATVLVELHDELVQGTSQRIRDRFQASHDIQEITSRARTLNDFPLPDVDSELANMAMENQRDFAGRWFFMTPLHN